MPRAIIITLILTLSVHLTAMAQYHGGTDDGMAYSSAATAQTLGMNIYKGGNDDGFALLLSAAQPLGTNIYKGGNDDGFVMLGAVAQPLGMNIYKGGNDDGWAIFSTATQPLGMNIFKGGNDDGWVMLSAATPLPLGANIYKGGSDDGWAMAIGTNLTLVPVTLVSYDAKWQGANVLNSWQTSAEQNTDHFEIQRSINGINFNTVGQVPAAGNSTTLRNYAFTDVNVNANYSSVPPRLYYRLKTVDRDGQIVYSAIVVLSNGAGQEATLYTLYPNPADQQLIIEMKGTLKKYTFQLINASGQVLLQRGVTQQKETLHTDAYPSGTYYIQVIDTESKSKQSFKILIVH